MDVTFTMMARVQLLQYLRQIRGTKDDAGRKMARKIVGKLKYSKETADRFTRTEGQNVLVNLEVINDKEQCPDLTVDITEDQATMLLKIINTKEWGTEDDDWFEALEGQLKEAEAGLKSDAK